MNTFDAFCRALFSPWWAASAVSLLTVTAFYGCGRLLPAKDTREDRLGAFALGCALLMTALAVMPLRLWVLLLLLVPFALYGLWLLAREAVSLRREYAAFLLLFLAGAGSSFMLPCSWDEQTYQLAVPVRILLESSPGPFPDNPYSFYPALTGGFFTRLIRMGGVQTPRIVVSLITPILVLSVWKMIRRSAGAVPAGLGAAAFLLSPLTLALNRGTYVENFIALFTLAGIAAAARFREKKWTHALVCGILAGAAAAVKPTGAVGALAIACIFAGASWGEWKKWLVFAFSAFFFCFFWYLRTFLLTGSFFYPYALFPVPGSVEHFHYLLGSARYGLEGLPGLLLNWLFAGFYGKLFDGIVTGLQFPFLLVCAAAVWYFGMKEAPEKRLKLFFAALAVLLPGALWSLCFPQSRFIMPLLAPVAVAGGMALARLPRRKFWYAGTALLLAATAFFQSYPHLKHYYVCWRLAGKVQNSPGRALAYLTRDPGYFQAMERLAALTPENSKVLLLLERRGLYCPRPCRLAVPRFEPSFTPVPENAEKLFEKLRAFDYIVVGSTTQDVDLQSANEEECKQILLQLEELLNRGLLQFLPGPGYRILKVIRER